MVLLVHLPGELRVSDEIGVAVQDQEVRLPEGWRGGVLQKQGRKMERFWPCRCGWQTAGSAPIEKSFRNVAIRRDGRMMVSFSRSKRRFVLKRQPSAISTRVRAAAVSLFRFMIFLHIILGREGRMA